MKYKTRAKCSKECLLKGSHNLQCKSWTCPPVSWVWNNLGQMSFQPSVIHTAVITVIIITMMSNQVFTHAC